MRRATYALVAAERGIFVWVIGLNALAAAAGLAGPWLIGSMINHVRAGSPVRTIDELALALVGFAVAQLLLTRFARNLANRFGERTSARLREQFVERTLRLPARIVERSGVGDLTIRGTADVGQVAAILRNAAPDVLISAIQALLILVAVFIVSPLFGLLGVTSLLGITLAVRWYLRRARQAYLAEGAARSELAEALAGTASGARTIEALGLQSQRIATTSRAIEASRRTQLRTLDLRSVLFPAVDVSYVLPVVTVLLIGGWMYQTHAVSLGAIVAALLYLQRLSAPMDAMLIWLESLQSAAASFARTEGLAAVAEPKRASPGEPAGEEIMVQDVRFAYVDDQDVVRGVDLVVQPGERLAVVGASGAGKSTLGRLLAGIDSPRTGTVSVGGVAIGELAPSQRRRHVVLVTQEHHVFTDSLRENLLIAAPHASDPQLLTALAAVGADWIEALPDGLDTTLGDDVSLDGAQAQQLALARVVLADPHTLILDEATALLDPTTARATERALAATLAGRTVIAIAHRLATAYDADRVAVMDAGRIVETGSHAELVATDAAYAALWHSWHPEPSRPLAAEQGCTRSSPPHAAH